MEEKRQHTRAKLVVKVANRETKEFHYFYSRDVSQGGMFLETREPYPVGTKVELDFFVPLKDEKERIVARGAVIRTIEYKMGKEDTVPGMGIEFTEPAPEVVAIIVQYVRENLVGDSGEGNS